MKICGFEWTHETYFNGSPAIVGTLSRVPLSDVMGSLFGYATDGKRGVE
jgi:hypothetical protein